MFYAVIIAFCLPVGVCELDRYMGDTVTRYVLEEEALDITPNAL
jgi:hypothetical protein